MLSDDGEALPSEAIMHSPTYVPSDTAKSSKLISSWYAAHVQSRHEKAAVRQLELRGVESFLPLYRARHQWRNRTTVEVELPLFPGYLFVRIQPQQRAVTLGTPSILKLVGAGFKATPIGDAVIEGLRVAAAQDTAEPYPFIKIGSRVRVIRGSLAGVEGLLVQKKQSCRFILSADLIMQAMSVEIDAADLEPIFD